MEVKSHKQSQLHQTLEEVCKIWHTKKHNVFPFVLIGKSDPSDNHHTACNVKMFWRDSCINRTLQDSSTPQLIIVARAALGHCWTSVLVSLECPDY